MSRTTIRGLILAVVGFGGAVAPSTVQAEESPWNIRRAEAMEARAVTLVEDRSQWQTAAWMYREAASLRPVGDVEAVVSLRKAALLTYYTGRTQQAVELLAHAGQRAMEGGDVFTAANLQVDAAWVAVRTGEGARARAFLVEARRLVETPVLSAAVRGQVLGRIAGEAFADL